MVQDLTYNTLCLYNTLYLASNGKVLPIMRLWNAVTSGEPRLAQHSSAALHNSRGEWLDVEVAIVQRAPVRNLSSETHIPPLPSPGNLSLHLRASTSPSAWGTQALLGCLLLTIASFNHPFLFWRKKKANSKQNLLKYHHDCQYTKRISKQEEQQKHSKR